MAGTRLTMEAVGVFENRFGGKVIRWREYFDQKSPAETLGAVGVSMPE